MEHYHSSIQIGNYSSMVYGDACIGHAGGKGHPACEILSQIQAFAKLTSKWSGHLGTDHTLRLASVIMLYIIISMLTYIAFTCSIGEWPALLQGCSGLLFFCPERILAHLPPSRLAALSLKGQPPLATTLTTCCTPSIRACVRY